MVGQKMDSIFSSWNKLKKLSSNWNLKLASDEV